MPKHDFEFEVYPQGDYSAIMIASGYDHEINLSIDHYPNWWLHLLRHPEDGYLIDIQMGNHNAVILEASRDGLRGVDEDRVEVRTKGLVSTRNLTKAMTLVKEYETRIVYAMEALHQDANKA